MSEQPDRMDLHGFRASRRRKTDNVLKEDHRDLKRFFALDSAAYRDLTASGGLDEKTKELLGLVASTVLRCNDCIAYHCDRCVEVGWEKAQLLDALNVALVIGGSITIPPIPTLREVGWERAQRRAPLNVALVIGGSIPTPHIRTVWEVVEQLYEEKAEKAAAPARTTKLNAASAELKAAQGEREPSTAVLTAGQKAPVKKTGKRLA